MILRNKSISTSSIFIISSVIVNAANYGFNLLLGRFLGAIAYADAVFYTTLALAFSFVALMFQMTATRFVALHDGELHTQQEIRSYLHRLALIWGFGLGLLLSFGAIQLQKFFQLQSIFPLIFIGLSLPIYFLMSIGRGFLQGKLLFSKLTLTYQAELWVKVFGTLILLYFGLQASSVALATVFSFLAAFLFCLPQQSFFMIAKPENHKVIFSFFISVGFYELSQILINNSDVFLAKSYLTPLLAGQYASLAMIGRIVFFSSFPIVMVIVPMIITKIKNKESYQTIFYGSFLACAFVITCIVLACYFFGDLAMDLLFGKEFVAVAPFLWQYAVATGLFTLCNILIYFHISLNQKNVIWLAIAAGCLQIALIYLQHKDIQDFINSQIAAMAALFLSVLFYHLISPKQTLEM